MQDCIVVIQGKGNEWSMRKHYIVKAPSLELAWDAGLGLIARLYRPSDDAHVVAVHDATIVTETYDELIRSTWRNISDE